MISPRQSHPAGTPPSVPVIAPAPNQPAPRPVSIHIDELVLHGFPALDRYRVADALTGELTRLLQETGLPRAWNDASPQRDRPPAAVQVSGAWTPESLGRAIARAMVQGGSPSP